MEHTFTTGRSAVLRRGLPTSELVRTGQWSDSIEALFRSAVGQAEPTREQIVEAQDAICLAMFVTPRLSLVAEDGRVPIAALEESEVEETVMLALGGRELWEAFRGLLPGGDAGTGSGSDGDAPKHAPERPSGRAVRGRGGARNGRA